MWVVGAPSSATARGRCEALDPEKSSHHMLIVFFRQPHHVSEEPGAALSPSASRPPFAPTSASAIIITSMLHSSAGGPLAVNKAPGQSLRALMTCRFWLATLSREHILDLLRQPSASKWLKSFPAYLAAIVRQVSLCVGHPSHGGGRHEGHARWPRRL
jgi:hypothetical protein